MKGCLVVAAAFAALAIFLEPAPAAASLTLCNHTSYGNVTVAWGAKWYLNAALHVVTGGTQGWFTIPKGACSVLTAVDISRDDIFIYAYAPSHPSKTWSGDHYACLDPKHKFTYRDPDFRPPCSYGKSYGMRYIETNGNVSFTEYLTD